jgi:glutamine synthetase type III
VKKVPEELEPLVKAQLDAMRNQIEKLKGLVIDTEDHTARLKNVIANDLVDALVKRFQNNERKMDEMHEKIINIHQDIKDQLLEVRRLRDRQESDIALQKAITKILEEGEIKVDSEPLYELKV